MAISQAMVTSFKKALLDGEMDFSSDTSQTFKIALFTSSATLGATTTAFSATNEVSGGDPAVAVLDFGVDKTSTAGNFTIQFPTADASNAIIRIA